MIASSDPEFGSELRETADRREDAVRELLPQLDAGASITEGLERLGIRWIVALTDLDERRLDALERQPGLTPRLNAPDIRVWEVDGWRGEAIADDGTPVAVDDPVAPMATVDSSEPTTWHRAGGPGWLRGLSPASVTDEGLLRVPGGSGPLWFWPAMLVLLADLAVVIAAVVTARSLVGGTAVRDLLRRRR